MLRIWRMARSTKTNALQCVSAPSSQCEVGIGLGDISAAADPLRLQCAGIKHHRPHVQCQLADIIEIRSSSADLGTKRRLKRVTASLLLVLFKTFGTGGF